MKPLLSIILCVVLFTAASPIIAQQIDRDKITGRTGIIFSGPFSVAENMPATILRSAQEISVPTIQTLSKKEDHQIQSYRSVVDSLSTHFTVPAGKSYSIQVNQIQAKLIAGNLIEPLTAKAKQAIAKAPRWLRYDLTDNLQRLVNTTDQDRYAQIILDATDPYVDEIAFCVAHLPSQVLLNGSFNPALITLNAQLIYQYDQALNYVELVNVGTSTDDDYYTTTRYTIADTSGNTSKIDLPRDIYYWYLVDPKVSDEFPSFIDPNTGTPASRPSGVFWREYYWTANDLGNPLLKDKLQGINVAWCQRVNEDSARNGAIGMVTRWVKTVMKFGAGQERPIQPVRIYKIHKGNCGEWSDISCAAARTALIPCTNADASGDDHTWNEFWFGRWIHWEPTNTFLDYPQSYENWGWVVGSVTNWRGDAFYWPVTPRYTPSCTLTVKIKDADDRPVDGARVSIAAHFRARDSSNIMIVTYGYTDANGNVVFYLGDNKKLYIRVDSKLGSIPPAQNQVTQIIDPSVPNTQYTWSAKLPGKLSTLNPLPPATIYAPVNEYQADVSFSVPNEINYGRNIYDAVGSECSNVTPTGNIGVLCLDEDNYQRYLAGQSFNAGKYQTNSSASSFSYIFPTRHNWYLVFTNEEKIIDKQAVDVNIILRRGSAPPTGTIDGTVTLTGKSDYTGVVINTDTGEKDVSIASGHFTLNNVTAGRHIIRASFPGYMTKQIDTVSAQGTTTNLQIVLTSGLSAPQTLRGSVTKGIADLAWDPVTASDFQGYNIYRQLTPNINPQFVQPLNGKPVLNPEFHDSSVVGGKTYYYCVTAVYATGSSAASNEISVTIPSSIEMTYDDGVGEGGIGIPQVPSGGLAVRFTPTFYPAKIQTIKFYVQHILNDVDVQCWTGQTSPSQTMITPLRIQKASVTDRTWVSADISTKNAVVNSGDFYAGILYLATNTGQYADLYIGADTTFNGTTFQNRSWVRLTSGWYPLSAVNNGQFKWDLLIRAVVTSITGVEEEIDGVPTTISLSQNYPNPFSTGLSGDQSTTITFTIHHLEYVTLKIYNSLGKEIKTLLSEDLVPGTYQTKWNASGLPGGVYFMRATTSKEESTKKIIIVR